MGEGVSERGWQRQRRRHGKGRDRRKEVPVQLQGAGNVGDFNLGTSAQNSQGQIARKARAMKKGVKFFVVQARAAEKASAWKREGWW